jgi:hypothetical protein
LQQASAGQAGSEQVDREARSHNLLERHLGSIKEERDYGLGYGEKFRLQHVRDYHVMGGRVILTISTSCVSQPDLMPMPDIKCEVPTASSRWRRKSPSAERARFGAVGFLRIATTRGPPPVVNPGPRVDAIRRARPVVSSSSSSSKAPLGGERAANIHSYVLPVDPFTIQSEPPLT